MVQGGEVPRGREDGQRQEVERPTVLLVQQTAVRGAAVMEAESHRVGAPHAFMEVSRHSLGLAMSGRRRQEQTAVASREGSGRQRPSGEEDGRQSAGKEA